MMPARASDARPTWLRVLFAPSRNIDGLARVLAICLFVALFLLLLIQIASRALFNQPMGWVSELATFMLVASIWLSAPVFTRSDAHIRIEFFYRKLDRLSPRLKRLLDHVIDAASVLFLVVVCASAVRLAVENFDSLSPALHIRYTYLYLMIAAAAAAMAYFVLEVTSRRR